MFDIRLKAAREANGLSQAELARGVGVTRDLINKYEKAGIKPSFGTLVAIAECLNVSTDYLLGVDEPAPDAKKAAEGEITFDDFEFALYGEVRELNDEEKAELLKNAQRMNELRKLRNKAADGGE